MTFPPHITRYYQESPYFGAWPENTPQVQTARVGSYSAGEILQLQLKLAQQQVVDIRVQAYGCPYSIAAVAYLAEWALNQPLSQLITLHAADIEVALALPASKRHTALLAEDLLRKIVAACET